MRYLDDVVTLAHEPSLCNGCRICTTVCPHAVWSVQDKVAVIADRDACMECGACARNCEPGAITVRAGVGCAAALIAGSLGIKSACCYQPPEGEAADGATAGVDPAPC
jgi:ferredoxin